MYSAVHDLLVSGRDLRVYANGSGAPVLMLHDLGDSAAVFEPLTGAVCAAGRELVAVDLPGSGHSDPVSGSDVAASADALAEALPELSHDPMDIVGHGYGGYLALTLAAEHPELVDRLVVVDPLAPPRSGGRASARMPVGMAVNGAITTLRRGRLRQNLQGLGRARNVLDRLAEPDPAWWGQLARITAPTLVLGHRGAPTAEQALLDQLAEAIPGAVRNTTGGGRRPHAVEPDDFAGHVLDFVGRRDGTTTR
jgi:esterase